MLPKKAMCLKEDTVSGFKINKERVTLLLCTNMTGTHKFEPLVIGKFANPRCFKEVKTLPCKYSSNRSSWMTKLIFESAVSD